MTEATDRRVAQSVASVKTALIDLSHTYAPSQISISLLCKTAGISRPTFYEHFDGVYAVYDAIVMDHLAEFEPSWIETCSGDSEEAARSRIIAMLEHLDANRTEIAALLDSQTAVRQAGQVVHSWTEHHMALRFFDAPMEELSPEHADRVRFISSGMIGILAGRIMDTGTPRPPAETAERMIGYVDALRGSRAERDHRQNDEIID